MTILHQTDVAILAELIEEYGVAEVIRYADGAPGWPGG